MKIRLAKYLADHGLCSRRAASRLIDEGRVLVNQRPANHIDHVDEDDSIQVDGQPFRAVAEKHYLLYHKPVGIDCNLNPEKADSLYHLLQQFPMRLFPVGRLDKDSCGLVLLTNDGELTQRLLHPDFYHEKTYQVRVDIALTTQALAQLASGVSWTVGPNTYQSRPCQVTQLSSNRFEIVLTQGLNRQIRYMCRSVGLKVVQLKRIQLAQFSLADLAEGCFQTVNLSAG
ncbi:pseudouridine synthase [Rheinheimera tangshanensis]|jgi:pseudouridine synthase|uniref:Pseudouridine synthase n=1 Tax=Rheinheimera tangshanensis TaxID=400153 RepID=A0A5C8LWT4_9GAMM|nr:RNA pseudouridine synthase [Rheinheimera tangshanensis]TXK81751.1 pseudouridine synthase [Rheinheimera tangshanensis]GGM55459.1 pseudouridine synthase [Rheinheimera tangshanensis]